MCADRVKWEVSANESTLWLVSAPSASEFGTRVVSRAARRWQGRPAIEGDTGGTAMASASSVR